MRHLSIYSNEKGKTILHEDGFSLLAALALPLWLLRCRLYKTFFIIFPTLMLINIQISIVLQQIDDELKQVLAAALWQALASLISGKSANRLHRMILERSGYIRIAIELEKLS